MAVVQSGRLSVSQVILFDAYLALPGAAAAE